jgi:hypothetical protein
VDDPARGLELFTVDGDEVVAGLVEDALEFVGGVGGLAIEQFLLGLRQPLAGLRRFAAQRRWLRRGRPPGLGAVEVRTARCIEYP